MKTKLQTYRFDTSTAQGKADWEALKTRLEAEPGRGRIMEAIPTGKGYNPEPGEIELETEHLFDNQWNSDKGRVFDFWCEVVYSYGRRSPWRCGHWLEITPEMVAIRRETLTCGYTGMHFKASDGHKFNLSDSALGSEYLKAEELHLLRLLPVCESFGGKRAPLTEAERAEIMPLYIAAQTRQDAARDAEGNARNRKRYEKDKAEFEQRAATMTKRLAEFKAGWEFLFNRGLSTRNVIYYDHSGEFCFGWQGKGYSPEVAEQWRELLKEFPAPFKVEEVKP